MRKRQILTIILAVGMLIATIGLPPQTVQADNNYTWDGGGGVDTDWSNVLNWNPDGPLVPKVNLTVGALGVDTNITSIADINTTTADYGKIYIYGNGNDTTVTGTLDCYDPKFIGDSTMTIIDGASVGFAGEASLDSGLDFTVNGTGRLWANDNQAHIHVKNGSTAVINDSGQLNSGDNGFFNIRSGSTVTMNGANALIKNGRTTIDSGTLIVNNGLFDWQHRDKKIDLYGEGSLLQINNGTVQMGNYLNFNSGSGLVRFDGGTLTGSTSFQINYSPASNTVGEQNVVVGGVDSFVTTGGLNFNRTDAEVATAFTVEGVETGTIGFGSLLTNAAGDPNQAIMRFIPNATSGITNVNFGSAINPDKITLELDTTLVTSPAPMLLISSDSGINGELGNVRFNGTYLDAVYEGLFIGQWWLTYDYQGTGNIGLNVLAPELTWDGATADWAEGAGTDSHWDGAAAGDLPSSTVRATVNNGSATVSDTRETESLGVGSGGSVVVATGGQLTIGNFLNIASGGAVNADDGTLVTTPGTSMMNVSGTISTAGALDGKSLSLFSGASVSAAGINITGKLTLDSNGPIDLAGGNVTVGDKLIVNGTLDMTAVNMGSLDVSTAEVFVQGGSLKVNEALSAVSLDYSGGTIDLGGQDLTVEDLTLTTDFATGAGQLTVTNAVSIAGSALTLSRNAGGTTGRLTIDGGNVVGGVIAADVYAFTNVADYTVDLVDGAGASTLIVGEARTSDATVKLSGTNNSYTGTTTINRGVLEVSADAANLGAGRLVFNSSNDSQTAILQTSGTITRTIGNGAGQDIYWQGRGGFAASDAPLHVTLLRGDGDTTKPLDWSDTNNGFRNQILQMGSPTATAPVTLANDIELDSNRVVYTFDNPNSSADVSILSGDIVRDGVNDRNFCKKGSGTLWLTGSNEFNDAASAKLLDIQGGKASVVRAVDGAGLPANAVLYFNQGVFESSGNFTRSLGNASGKVYFQNHGGFSAYGAPLNVYLNDSGLTGAVTVHWNGATGFNGKELWLGSATANDVVTLHHTIDGDGGDRNVYLMDNPDSASDKAVISGDIVNIDRIRFYGSPAGAAGELLIGGSVTSGKNNENFEVLDGADVTVTGTLNTRNGATTNGGIHLYGDSELTLLGNATVGNNDLRVNDNAQLHISATSVISSSDAMYFDANNKSTGAPMISTPFGSTLTAVNLIEFNDGAVAEINGVLTLSGGGSDINMYGNNTQLTIGSKAVVTLGDKINIDGNDPAKSIRITTLAGSKITGVNNFDVKDGAIADINGEITMTAPGSDVYLTNNATLTVGSTGVINVNDRITLQTGSVGRINGTLNGGTGGLKLESSPVGGELIVSATGAVTTAGQISSSGKSSMTIDAGGVITATHVSTGHTVTNDATAQINGTLNITGATADLFLKERSRMMIGAGGRIAVKDDFYVQQTATLGGGGTIDLAGGAASVMEVNLGTTLTPGDSVGALNIIGGGELFLRTGANYEWEIGQGETDTIDIVGGKLNLQNFKLKILDADGFVANAADELPVFTYESGATTVATISNMDAVVFDTSALDGGLWDWSAGLALGDDGAGTIYLTGLVGGVDLSSYWDGTAGDYNSVHWLPAAGAPAGLPVPDKNMVVNSGIVTVSTDITGVPAKSLSIARDLPGGTVDVIAGGKLMTTGDVNVGSGGSLTVAGELNAPILNSAGETNLADASGAIGTVNVTGGKTTLASAAVWQVNATGGELDIAGGAVTNLNVDGAAVNTTAPAAVSDLSVTGGALNLAGGGLTVATANVTGGALDASGSALIVSGGGSARLNDLVFSNPTHSIALSGADLADSGSGHTVALDGGTTTLSGLQGVAVMYDSFDDGDIATGGANAINGGFDTYNYVAGDAGITEAGGMAALGWTTGIQYRKVGINSKIAADVCGQSNIEATFVIDSVTFPTTELDSMKIGLADLILTLKTTNAANLSYSIGLEEVDDRHGYTEFLVGVTNIDANKEEFEDGFSVKMEADKSGWKLAFPGTTLADETGVWPEGFTFDSVFDDTTIRGLTGDAVRSGSDGATAWVQAMRRSGDPYLLNISSVEVNTYGPASITPVTSILVESDSTLALSDHPSTSVALAGVETTAATTLTIDSSVTDIQLTNLTLGDSSMVRSTLTEETTGTTDVNITVSGTLNAGGGDAALGDSNSDWYFTNLALSDTATLEWAFSSNAETDVDGGGTMVAIGDSVNVMGALAMGDGLTIQLVDGGGSSIDGVDVALFGVMDGATIDSVAPDGAGQWTPADLDKITILSPAGAPEPWTWDSLEFVNDEYVVLTNLVTGAVVGPHPGDATGPLGVPDGVVDELDLALFNAQLGVRAADQACDFDGDGDVDLDDFATLRTEWGWGVPTAPEFPASATPEPATMSLLAIGGLIILRRRRRQSC